MNFILEVLPKKAGSKDYLYVVRAQNGYPLAVCESLTEANEVIASNIEKLSHAES